jgi:type I restriction-modification system DNA methylase subunit
MKALTPSPALAAVVGATPLPRTEVVSKLWAYIKKNKLQDAVNKRNINADAKLKEIFGTKAAYGDIPGLCKAASLAEIEAQGWSLNPGRYVGVAPGDDVTDEDFKELLEALNEELSALNSQARELEETIAQNVAEVLEG